MSSSSSDQEATCRICSLTQSESVGSKMIKPCKCKGTLEYVHIDCLNQWRATSMNAFYECQVCKYKYELRRTFFAELLLSDNGAFLVTILLIITIILVCGVLLYYSTRYFNFNFAQHIYKLADIDHQYNRYRYICSVSHPPRNSLVEYITNHYNTLACNILLSGLIDITVCGMSITGTIGFSKYILIEINRARLHGDNGIQQLFIFGAWLASISNKALSRLALVIGTAIAFRELYNYVAIYGRKFATTFGEMILEVS